MSTVFLLPQKWERTGFYATMIAWNINQKKPKSFRYRNFKKRFGNFYFRSHATKVELFLSKAYTFFILLCVSLLILILVKGAIK